LTPLYLLCEKGFIREEDKDDVIDGNGPEANRIGGSPMKDNSGIADENEI
jgi:hypothetical protein